MFAYCLNNPIAYSDNTGSAAKICFSAASRVEDSPWRDLSPSGGGRMPANYTSPHSYGSVSDKFYTIRFLKFIFNTDEQAVLDAEYFAFYKGQLVIREDWAFTNGRSGSFIIMFLNSNETDVNTVRHEWGHFVQLLQLGIVEYTFSILLPSVLSDPYNKHYYSNPWEITADIYGVTNRNYTYLNGSAAWGYALLNFGPIVVPLYYLFGNQGG